jgi:alkaline phosphatase
MKLRNQLLALFCLLLFVAFGIVYFRTYVAPKPFGIILVLGDGLSPSTLAAARLYEGGADHRLAIDRFPHLALLRNSARDFAVPDAAAASPAIATGQTGAHRQLSIDARNQAIKTIAEMAQREGRSVGIVTNGQLTDSSIAAFYAHVPDARETAAVAAQLAQQKTIDLALGGGAAQLDDPLRKAGTEIVSTKAELENVANFRTQRLAGLFAPGDLAPSDKIESGSQQPSLSDMTRRAIQILQTNGQGYLLIVDAALVTRAAERNEGERTIVETLALDHAIATAVRYAGDRALIIAAGKHGIGGFSLNGFPLHADHGVGLLGVNPAGYPAVTWATGPNGPGEAPPPRARTEPAAAAQPAAIITAQDMIAVGIGNGAEKLRGIIDSTEIFQILRGAL